MPFVEDVYPSRCHSAPHTAPRLDPVVHGAWTPDAPLTREQTQRFEEDGFLILEDLFDATETGHLIDAARRLMARPDGLEPETVVREPQDEIVRSIFAIHDQSPLFARLAADARLARVASFLLDDEVYVHQSRLNYKPGFRGRDFFWHSDFETWHTEDGMPRMRAVSASILLTPNDANNGPLMLIPGSHRQFIGCVGETPDAHYKASLRRQEIGVPDPATLERLVAENGIAPATGKAGTVILFDCNTIHGSNGNITPHPRSNAFFVYNAMSNRVTAPFAAREPRPRFLSARGPVEPVRPVEGRIEPDGGLAALGRAAD